MAFDPEVALRYARALARPRLVGSGEEEKVASEIIARLAGFGYHVESESFKFTRAFEIALAAEIALALVVVVLALLFPNYAIIFGSSLLVLLVIAQPLNRAIQYHAVAPDPDSGAAVSPLTAICLRLGRLYRAANIVAQPADQSTKRLPDYPAIYLVSHLDSKSQRLPIPVRIFLFVVFIPGLTLFALSALFQSLITNLQPLTILLGLLSLLAGIPLFFLDVRNESPGAIDNASGTGLLLHLAEVLRSRPDLLSKIRLTLLITSAEEMATMGALYHVKRRATALRDDALFVLNFDGIGVDGKLYVAGRPLPSPTAREAGREGEDLAAFLHRASAELHIPLATFSLVGVLFDHIPFADRGLNAATLLAIGSASRFVHTARDSADKLHPRGFEMAGRVALRVIEELATRWLPPLSAL